MRLSLLPLIGLVACASAPPPATPPVEPPPAVPPATSPEGSPATAPGPLDDDQRAALTQSLDELAALGTGASLAVWVDGQTIPFVTGTMFDDGPPVAPTTRFGVASVSKLLTAARVVTLAHAGELSLTDPVAKHLPGVHFVDEHGTNLADRITIDQLLRHRSGLPHWDPSFDPEAFDSSWQDPELLTKMSRSWTVTLKNPPGTYAYANLGYATLAAIVEAVQHCSFADCMRDFFDRDLGLARATMWPPSLTDDFAKGRREKDGQVEFLAPSWYGSRIAIPYSGLWIAMPDLARFGARLIAAQDDPAAPLHAMTNGVPPGQKGHGRGPVHTRLGDADALRHDGSGPGFLADFIVVPSEHLVLAVAVNGGGDTKEGAQTLRRVTDRMLASLTGDR